MSAQHSKSAGQNLVESIERWLSSFLSFPDPSYGLVAAMWAINTHVFQVFDATPYLAVTAATKRAGKSTLLELLGMLSKNAELFGAATPAAMFRMLEQYDGWMTIFFDEAEALSSESAGVMRSFYNLGYRKGQAIPRTMPGGQVQKFGVFCPKAFGLIGDPMDTLRDRSILFVMERGKAERQYRRSVAEVEGAELQRQIAAFIKADGLKGVEVVVPEWLEDRDQEIWTPLVSLAHAMGFDRALMDRLVRASSDLVARKSQPIRRYVDQGDAEAKAQDNAYAERAIRDLARVLREDGGKGLFSAVAVERMRAIPEGPWRTFKGDEGLTQVRLADLVSRFGVHTATVWVGSGRKARKSGMGYSAASVLASVPRED